MLALSADGRTRTYTDFRPPAPKAGVSTIPPHRRLWSYTDSNFVFQTFSNVPLSYVRSDEKVKSFIKPLFPLP